jgi:N-acyl-D-aspartate/D-glutamate deacylase
LGILLFTLSNPQWASSATVIDGIRQNSLGVCVWAKIGHTNGRCNVNPGDNINFVGAELTGLTGVVSQSFLFKSFTIGQF